ncbi:hypothetical protein N7536_007730 [Penicillium majusculum]|nr:hypothetical protein N7536_007730 [Penicillium majusculum]
MALISSRIMSRPLLRLLPSTQSVNVGLWHRCSFATAPPSNQPHPNPGNFANRPREELSEIAHKGGKKGGKATGVGGGSIIWIQRNSMPSLRKAVALVLVVREKKAPGNGETELEAEKRSRSHEPSVVPPGFAEWKTMA